MIQGVDGARLYFQQRRASLLAEIANLSGRLEEIERLLLELDAPARDDRPDPPAPRSTQSRSANTTATGMEVTREALKKAGAKGITAQQIAHVMKVPVGTASSRLSQLLKTGEATHLKPFYYTTGGNPSANATTQP